MAFVQAHPEAVHGLQAFMTFAPPESYARLVYRGLHAFRFVGADGDARFVRYRWEPRAGIASLSDDEARARPERYLRDELYSRLKSEPVVFDLHVQIGTDADPTADPTVEWPSEREDVVIGTLVIEEPIEDCEEMLFDPMMLVDGIEASDDEILRARSGAYAVSFKRRRAPRPS